MPMYDRRCPRCDWSRDDAFEPSMTAVHNCPKCGAVTDRVFASGSRHGGVTVIDDTIPGGLTLENLGHDPVTVYSRSELKREMAARGLEPMVRHVGKQGSDKSPHTSRWI